MVVIFPEGKTNYGKELLPFKAGAAILAHSTGAPIVPFAILGTEQLYPDGSKVFHAGRVGIQFGTPFQVGKKAGELSPSLVAHSLNRMRARIQELRAPLRKLKLGRGRDWAPTSLMGAGLLKMLSLALLTVDWSRR